MKNQLSLGYNKLHSLQCIHHDLQMYRLKLIFLANILGIEKNALLPLNII
tara:strand:+ start:3067 stop:3216 length:150 start_codon:yes stop_codon:yes gene_type:complete